MRYLLQTIRGQEHLSIVFWGYCVAGLLAITGLLFLLTEHMHRWPTAVLSALATLQVVYIVWAHISLWSCAFNAKRPIWGYAARIYVAVVTLAFLLLAITPKEYKVEAHRVVGYVQQALQADAAAQRGLR